jgi:hypothetical protein
MDLNGAAERCDGTGGHYKVECLRALVRASSTDTSIKVGSATLSRFQLSQ